jgi:hypothetical protein
MPRDPSEESVINHILGYAIHKMWVKLREIEAPTNREHSNHEGDEKNDEK